jgi:hypothetical protein
MAAPKEGSETHSNAVQPAHRFTPSSARRG